jgi:hypothetical protein
MPQVGFAPKTGVFEQAKTVHASDGAATLIGTSYDMPAGNLQRSSCLQTLQRLQNKVFRKTGNF